MRIRLAIASLLLLLLSTASGVSRAERLKLLFMGNSYTMGNNLPRLLSEIAVADGYEAPLIVTDLAGGQNVAYHRDQVVNNPRSNVTSQVVEGMKFDAVVVQGQSLEATRIGDPASRFIPDSAAWAEAVRSSGLLSKT